MRRRVRTRYAPSPTGFQHIGGIRTAIINYLVAKKLGGEFLLRIEDTDSNRYVEEAEDYILQALKWLDISFSEGPDIGGNYGPYRQSERLHIYKKYAKKLVNLGKAYYAFDSKEELDFQRNLARRNSNEFLYNYASRKRFKNSYTLSKKEIEQNLKHGNPYVIRLAVPENMRINFPDEIRGNISVHTSQLEDKILLKSDGSATYHLASVVDDTLMEITHVIRGEEWLPSAPIHHYLYEAFGWQNTKPKFAHLPLILNPNGKGKLSKRKLKDAHIPIFPLSWTNSDGTVVNGMKEAGFLPDAVLNILVLLGWHESSDREIYSRQELFNSFDFKYIQKSGAKFDFQKAKWINSKHIGLNNDTAIAEMFLELKGVNKTEINHSRLVKTITIVKDRITTLKDIQQYESLYSKNVLVVPTCTRTEFEVKLLITLYKRFFRLENWDKISIGSEVNLLKSEWNEHPRNFYELLRSVFFGKKEGPNVVDMIEVLGKTESLRRIKVSAKEEVARKN